MVSFIGMVVLIFFKFIFSLPAVWSNLVAADVYSAFDEVKNNDEEIKKIGKRFRETFLSLGGSIHPSEVFRRFRGRDPCHKALVKKLGLSQYANIRMTNDENVKT
jgi:Peptidase family M3